LASQEKDVIFRYKLKTHKDMAMNSFHKYVSAARKSKSFKPVCSEHPIVKYGSKVIIVCKDKRTAWGSTLLHEAIGIVGEQQIVVSADHNTNEMYAYPWWL
jgi:hypothetical protein